MPKTKDASRSASKWVRQAGQASESYLEGVQNPRTPWKQATAAAGPRWQEGIQAAVARKAFDKGVAKTTEDTWSQGAVNKGASRYGPGVAVAESKYAAGIAPFLSVIQATDIGPRYPKGDPRNIERVRKLALALHARKIQ